MAANEDVVKEYLSKDYYKILGIDDKAKANDSQYLRQAYKSKSREVHPDKHQTEKDKWTEAFKKVNEAYTVLSDPDKKALYDQSIANNEKVRPEDYNQFFRSAEKANKDKDAGYSALNPNDIANDLRSGQSRIYIYIPPDFLNTGSATKTHCHGRNTSVSFEVDFPNGYYTTAKDLSYDEEQESINITIRKFRNITDTFPSINYNLESKTFLLAVQKENDYHSLPLVIGLITVSENHKFAVFSFIENLPEETIQLGLLWDGFKSLPNQFGSVYGAAANGYFNITQNLITSEQHVASLEQKQEMFENLGKKPKFTMELFKQELAVAQKDSTRVKLFGASEFVSNVLKGKPVSFQEIQAYAQSFPFGTVRKVLDKFDTSEQKPVLAIKP
ncbi:molecular chaperone DnaJ [Legionella gratiana]|uniref:Molecular chaperone DnaJ n=1 Tax=Legionella gratiana TaxID=45066 RepID=A0A378JF31_9GAMM|nr:DnaJ domain-containing protein [Legionella gratiana]KTD09167.1 molecular chaperone DnaJ [Legionella gratiana]STX45618.1 molecular chaperone DnaJ [Legionella gratiana]